MKAGMHRRYVRQAIVLLGIPVVLVTAFVAVVSAAQPSMSDNPISSYTDRESGLAAPITSLAPRRRGDDIRLLSYNIQWGMGADGVRDLDRIVTLLRHIDADIAVLNEVDVNWRRSGNVDQPRYIQQRTGYEHAYFGMALTTWASGNARVSRYGNLLLSRFPIVSARTVPLPAGWGREPRSAVAARLDVDGQLWIVVATHLGLRADERRQQVAALRQIAAEEAQIASPHPGLRPDGGGDGTFAPPPIVIAGDFNALPSAPEISLLTGSAVDDTMEVPVDGNTGIMVDAHEATGQGEGYTFPYPEPYARIDYVFVSPPLADGITAAAPYPVPGSDHLPVVVDVSRSSTRWGAPLPNASHETD